MNQMESCREAVPRILHFVPGFHSGGIESLLMSLYRCLDKSSLQFDFIVDTRDALPEFDEIRAAGGRVFQMGRYLDAPLRYQSMANEILAKHGPEYLALHSHTVIRALPLLWAARRHGISKRILHSHTDSLQGSRQALVAPIIASVTAPLATDYWACSDAAGRYFFGRRPYKVFTNTIRTQLFLFSPLDRALTREGLGIAPSTLVVGHTGRFTYQKNHDWLIRVFAELHRLRPDTRLLLVGAGPLEAQIRDLVTSLGVSEAISFVGLQADVAPFLSAMDVFFLPSHHEGFCISLLEAQANGLPCLASSAIPDEVQVTPTIRLCNLHAPLADWCDSLISVNQLGRSDSAANAKLIRESGYDTETQMGSLLAMYHQPCTPLASFKSRSIALVSGIKEKLLYRAPAWLKNAMLSTYGLIERRKRYGQFYRQRYALLKSLGKASPEAVSAFQAERLRELLGEVIEHSPWYRLAFQQCGVTAEIVAREPPLAVLSRLPILEKNTLKSRTAEVMSANPARQAFATVSTSGTSGSPMQVVFDADGRQATYAEWRRYHDWLGLPVKFRSVRFSGRIIVDPAATKPPFWAHNWAEKQLFMSTYHLKKDHLPAYIRKLNDFRPELIDGYPSALYILAQYLLKTGTRLSFTPAVISVTAETLMTHQREAIEQAFGCKVYNQYASSEGAPWIVECKLGHYHLWLDTGVFEFINPQPLDADTDMAELVVTSFRNLKTPLIRYRIGDFVQVYKHSTACPCGAPYPVIKGVIGRNDDILFTAEKGSVGRLDPAYKGVQGIRQSKIVQHSMDRLEVLVVPDENFDPSQQALLLQNLRERLGQAITIEFTLLDSMPLGKSGKLKSVERRFPLPELS